MEPPTTDNGILENQSRGREAAQNHQSKPKHRSARTYLQHTLLALILIYWTFFCCGAASIDPKRRRKKGKDGVLHTHFQMGNLDETDFERMDQEITECIN
ncbi:hypothetical protein AAZV13_15G011700 [Glycine max]